MKAWLLDGYVIPGSVRTWWISERGERFYMDRPFSPTFFVGITVRQEVVQVSDQASRQAAGDPWKTVREWCCQQQTTAVRLSQTQRMELHSGQPQPVLAVQVVDPVDYLPLVRRLTRDYPWLEVFQADVPVVQYAFHTWEWYPTMWCDVALNRCLDTREEIDPQVPVLRFLSLSLEGEEVNPRHGRPGAVVVRTWESGVPDRSEVEGVAAKQELILDLGEAEGYDTLRRLMLQQDPDVLFTDWGDDFLLPHLMAQAQRFGVPVPWNRDTKQQVHIGQEHTYFSYGQVRHRAPIITCFGRLHIDIKNSFLHTEGKLEGLFELARLSGLPVQRLARTTIGTAMSAMQLLTAVRRGVLIPVDKRQAEDWKTAEQLVLSDKGGLVYQPRLGFHEQVVELDFASLYPAIMVRFNVSPETVNCSCCPPGQTVVVPEIGYRICQRRRGLVSETLEIILHKRAEFKRRMKVTSDPVLRASYDHRQNTLKWILVTCFGYLGFKNARFGRIEAHESVTAFGRELLLRAKDMAERAGFQFLHGIVDSIWLHKPGVTWAEAEHLAQQILEVTHIDMKIEGMYHWIAFLPSKEDPWMPVANRYFGLFTSGEYKVRGIELRRHDTPRLVLRFQQAVLDGVADCTTVSALQDRLPHVLSVLDNYLTEVGRGTVPMGDLALNRRLSRDPHSYQQRTVTAIVAQELLGRGVQLSPGEMIQYVVTDAHSDVPETRARSLAWIDADWSYDVETYQELLIRAFDSLFASLGYTAEYLRHRQTTTTSLPTPHQRLP